jgi:hypothetical protein
MPLEVTSVTSTVASKQLSSDAQRDTPWNMLAEIIAAEEMKPASAVDAPTKSGPGASAGRVDGE